MHSQETNMNKLIKKIVPVFMLAAAYSALAGIDHMLNVRGSKPIGEGIKDTALVYTMDSSAKFYYLDTTRRDTVTLWQQKSRDVWLWPQKFGSHYRDSHHKTIGALPVYLPVPFDGGKNTVSRDFALKARKETLDSLLASGPAQDFVRKNANALGGVFAQKWTMQYTSR
jgi:hypothetical protein